MSPLRSAVGEVVEPDRRDTTLAGAPRAAQELVGDTLESPVPVAPYQIRHGERHLPADLQVAADDVGEEHVVASNRRQQLVQVTVHLDGHVGIEEQQPVGLLLDRPTP